MPEPPQDCRDSVDFLIAAIDDVFFIELTEKLAFMPEFTDFNVSFGPICEEEVLIICICFNPMFQI